MNTQNTNRSLFLFVFSLSLCIAACNTQQKKQVHIKAPIEVSPVLCGETGKNSIILQTRLVENDSLIDHNIQGTNGMARFEISATKKFTTPKKTPWQMAKAENDFIVKQYVDGLKSGKKYFYRVEYGKDTIEIAKTKIYEFKTLQDTTSTEDASFVMVTGMHYLRFYTGGHGGGKSQKHLPASGQDSVLGFPGYESIASKQPDFFIGNGDNVYYDHWFQDKRAKSKPEMRMHWHCLFSLPRFQNLLTSIPTYWLKDDHDFRFDDADTTNEKNTLPTVEDGKQLFIEQIPIITAKSQNQKTYRTYRVNKYLQIWMVEGRDYRSANSMQDSIGKTIWGEEQKQWLKETLLSSNATYKILITPTPMIGPDDKRKTDNHCNINGFQHERDEFFDWLIEHNFLGKNFYIICGDRHWKYHSIHPKGIEEFSCGALVDANSRLGVTPGAPKSTDPDGKIIQKYTDSASTGGFMHVLVKKNDDKPRLIITLYDEEGKQLYQCKKDAADEIENKTKNL